MRRSSGALQSIVTSSIEHSWNKLPRRSTKLESRKTLTPLLKTPSKSRPTPKPFKVWALNWLAWSFWRITLLWRPVTWAKTQAGILLPLSQCPQGRWLTLLRRFREGSTEVAKTPSYFWRLDPALKVLHWLILKTTVMIPMQWRAWAFSTVRRWLPPQPSSSAPTRTVLVSFLLAHANGATSCTPAPTRCTTTEGWLITRALLHTNISLKDLSNP